MEAFWVQVYFHLTSSFRGWICNTSTSHLRFLTWCSSLAWGRAFFSMNPSSMVLAWSLVRLQWTKGNQIFWFTDNLLSFGKGLSNSKHVQVCSARSKRSWTSWRILAGVCCSTKSLSKSPWNLKWDPRAHAPLLWRRQPLHSIAEICAQTVKLVLRAPGFWTIAETQELQSAAE